MSQEEQTEKQENNNQESNLNNEQKDIPDQPNTNNIENEDKDNADNKDNNDNINNDNNDNKDNDNNDNNSNNSDQKDHYSDCEDDKSPKENPYDPYPHIPGHYKNNSDSDLENHPDLPEDEIESIKTRIIDTRKEAGDLYKKSSYVEALNIYSLLLKDAKKAKLKDQIVILYCNKGICFNKLHDIDKALECFCKALKYDNNYSKALCNRMILYNTKEDYLEALEDFNRLKEIDKKLWDNYSYMEYGLQHNAEVKKKKMTDEMLGKLKDLGNTVLGKFGISLDNFKMTPNGQGGYSIQYQNNK